MVNTSSIYRVKDTHIRGIFPETYRTIFRDLQRYYGEPYLMVSSTDGWDFLPRRFARKKMRVPQEFVRVSLNRPFQLLYSPCELEREAQDQVSRKAYENPMYFVNLSARQTRKPHSDVYRYLFNKEDDEEKAWKEAHEIPTQIPRRYRLCDKLFYSLRRSRRIHIHDHDQVLAERFIWARACRDHQADFRTYDEYSQICDHCEYRWRCYRDGCQRRKVWGEYLRNDLNWEWDTSSSLRRLFGMKAWAVDPPANVVSAVSVEAGGLRGDTLDVSIDAPPPESVTKVRMAYTTASGETKYRTFYAGPSSEDVLSRPEERLESTVTGPLARMHDSSEQGGQMAGIAAREVVDEDRQAEPGSLPSRLVCSDDLTEVRTEDSVIYDDGGRLTDRNGKPPHNQGLIQLH